MTNDFVQTFGTMKIRQKLKSLCKNPKRGSKHGSVVKTEPKHNPNPNEMTYRSLVIAKMTHGVMEAFGMTTNGQKQPKKSGGQKLDSKPFLPQFAPLGLHPK